MSVQRSLLLLAIAAIGVPARAQSGFFLKDGDRVVFYGDKDGFIPPEECALV